MDMFASERKRSILQKIGEDGRVSATQLAVEFRTSEDTIRRTLRELAARGLCKRVYGGALAMGSASAPIVPRSLETGDRRAVLGAALAKTIERGQLVFLDGGTTNLAAARMIPENLELTVATHDPAIAAALATRSDITLIMIGGHIKAHLGSAVGVEATRQAVNLRPDLLLLGLCSLDALEGVTVFDHEDAAFKRVLVENSRSIVTAVLNEKLAGIAPFHVCSIKSLTTLVIEANADSRLTKGLVRRGLHIERAVLNV